MVGVLVVTVRWNFFSFFDNVSKRLEKRVAHKTFKEQEMKQWICTNKK